MNILTYTEARASFKTTMDNVCKHHEPAVITRQRGGHAVLMSLEDYNSTEETLYLLSSPRNAQRLMKSIEQLKAGSTKERDLITNGKQESEKQRSSESC